jgi:hypothetical protein
MEARDRIVLALDVDTKEKAISLVKELAGYVGVFKVGMQLYNSVGPDIVKEINDLGGKVFVDLKFHDIPNTVAAAGRVMAGLGCYMFNVHAAGGREMMQALSQELTAAAQSLKQPEPITLAVTVLTSISQEQLSREMYVQNIHGQNRRLFNPKIHLAVAAVYQYGYPGYLAPGFPYRIHNLSNRSAGSNHIFHYQDLLSRLDGESPSNFHFAVFSFGKNSRHP